MSQGEMVFIGSAALLALLVLFFPFYFKYLKRKEKKIIDEIFEREDA